MMSAFRWRLRFTFWLDLNKSTEAELAENISELKEKRSFASSIRDGLRLILDLRRGRTEVLQELFPWVLEQQTSLNRMSDDAPIPDAEEKFEHWLERMEDLFLRQGAIPIEAGKTASTPIPSRRNVPDIDIPDIEIRHVTNDENNNSTWNFMIASALNVVGDCQGLAPEIIEYGVRTGRIPPDKVPRSNIPIADAKTLKKASGNPTAMDVPQFAAPDFSTMVDDLDFDISEINPP